MIPGEAHTHHFSDKFRDEKTEVNFIFFSRENKEAY
jgi:hypothetical protein